jgi:hypothetical protein
MQQLDARNRGCGASEPHEAMCNLRRGLDVAKASPNQVVQPRRKSDFGVRSQQTASLHLALEELYRLAGVIHNALEADLPAASLQVVFTEPPRLSRRPAKA